MIDAWSPRLSEYIDGELSVAEQQGLEAHLRSCASCRAELEQLRGVVAWLQRDPPDAASAQAWAQVRDSISARQPWKRWLIAASIVAVATTTTVAIMRNRPEPVIVPGTTSVTTVSQPYQRAVTELEAILRAERGTLDPTTVAVLERSLATINTAIAEAEAALAADSTHEFMPRYLDHLRAQKIKTLREAAVLVRANRGS
jgi:anti-sigma factor RsiW